MPEPAGSVAEALAQARALCVDRLDAQWLLAHVLARPTSWLLAHDDALLEPDQSLRWLDALARRAAGEPLAYLLGEAGFHGLTLHVNPEVLVPRADTEVLVDWALAVLAGPLAGAPRPAVVDLGTGSGAIALAVKRGWRRAAVIATDQSAAALAVAGANAERLALDVAFLGGSWWHAVPGTSRFDLVLSNPPYIAAGDPHLPALQHEPLAALTPGGDGLGALRDIVIGAPRHMNPGGWLLLEHGFDQADAVREMLAAQGFEQIETRRDLGWQARCTGGRREHGGDATVT